MSLPPPREEQQGASAARSTGLAPLPKPTSFNFPARNSPQLAASTTAGRVRHKVALAPGHSPMDWARLKSSGEDLRGVQQLRRLTMEEVAKHNKRDDCWMVIYGKVYNVTRYMNFHPGGRGQLMRAAGKDGSKLFAETHSWVNVDMILDQCLVGFL
ncbi:hypothetical protein EC988_001380 [Linderina pennispora]|nr:hypothetical protein EC988_001380 [Linderina pennispora]